MIRGEFDGYTLPPPIKGDLTPEQVAEKEKARQEGLNLARELRQKYGSVNKK